MDENAIKILEFMALNETININKKKIILNVIKLLNCGDLNDVIIYDFIKRINEL